MLHREQANILINLAEIVLSILNGDFAMHTLSGLEMFVAAIEGVAAIFAR
jgi:hypothetical protein